MSQVSVDTQDASRRAALLRHLCSFLGLPGHLAAKGAPVGADQSLCAILAGTRNLIGQRRVHQRATWPGEPPTCTLCQRRLLASERAAVYRLGEQDALACPLCALGPDRQI